jgi:hypothetical protein
MIEEDRARPWFRLRRGGRVRGIAIAGLVALGFACSAEDERGEVRPSDEAVDAPSASRDATPASDDAADAARRRARDPRPSLVLVVLDTVRADAVSAYGEVVGTTPVVDDLAREGLRYSHAYAAAPWTVSSHASLFTGLRVDEHGVGLDGRVVAPEELEMLAEDLRQAGYQTAGFSANASIHRRFGFAQGFDRFEAPDFVARVQAAQSGSPLPPFGLLERVRDWTNEVDPTKPYFLFVNLFDAHDPYEVRAVNPWIPDGVPRSELEYVRSHYSVPDALCDAVPTDDHVALLRGLYFGDVAAADAKLGEIVQMLDERNLGAPRILVVTSDHGEHLGENRLMGHRFSVRNVALHVPLVVHGLPGAAPGVVRQPVELRALHASMLCWALGRACATSLPTSRPDPPRESDEPIFGIYSDSVTRVPGFLLESLGIAPEDEPPMLARAACGPDEPVFGEMVTMIRYPYKITWFSNHAPVLHDLRWDLSERSDQMERQPERAAALEQELEAFVATRIIDRPETAVPEPSEEVVRTLKSLGYVE